MKELRQSLLSSGTHFSLQTESSARYTKFPVVLKQVYVGEVWGESKVIWGNSSQQIPKKSALRFKNQVKSFIIWSDAESKGKKTALVCLEHFYELFATENSITS